MKTKFLAIIFLLCSPIIFSQVKYQKIFENNYDDIPIKIRIDNSGIYGISSFDVDGDKIYLNSFDDKSVYSYEGESFFKNTRSNIYLKDFVSGFESEQINFIERNSEAFSNKKVTFKKSYLDRSRSLFIDEGGILSNENGDMIKVTVVNRNELKIDFDFVNSQALPENFKKHMKFYFPSNLGFAEFIGIDKNGSIFILIETFISDIPLQVQREVYTISKQGELLSILSVPLIKYVYTVREFQIDEAGNLYHLLCEKEKVTIIKWSGLTNQSEEKINYPSEHNYVIHFNDFVTTYEIDTDIENKKEALASRVEAIRLGEKYVLYKYSCNAANLAPGGLVALDGDTIKTPNWLINGYNARIPYKWGGFNTLTGFSDGLSAGKYAGDIDTDGSSSYAVGVDCSGFVSRCWQMTYHASTSYMPSITTQYSSWDSLKPADAIHKVGHVRLFIERTSNGSFRVVESAGRNWDVSYWTFTLSDLATYTPRYYNNMTNDFSKQQPELISAIVEPNGGTKLTWTCDTTNIKGYRLYSSTDGGNWIIVLNENSLQTTSVIVNRNSNFMFYRVASVLNNSPAFSESPWSNVLGVGEYLSSKKVLIVDGFDRKTGSWRGNQHNFIMKYGKAIQPFSLDFESVKSHLVKDNLINLNDYETVIWISGDESTADETFSSSEQTRIKNFLENGGKFFVSGSEIGWDLYANGSSADKAFYNQYLKAAYIADNSASNIAVGINGSCFSGLNFNFGQTYYEDYPDEINTLGGSDLCMKYGNNKGAGIAYTGNFGSSNNIGKIIYLAFPLETTANDSAFNAVIYNSLKYFYAGSVKLIVEGLYDPLTNRLNKSDTVKAYLRNPFPPYSLADSATAIIDSITFTCNFIFAHASTGSYYLAVKHHNSLETWSKYANTFLVKGIPLNYDFTKDSSQAYGNNLKKVGTRWCIYSGDVNQDRKVDLNDITLIKDDAYNYPSGYRTADLNGDNFIDLNDLVICDNNVFNNVTSITPLTENISKPMLEKVTNEK